MKAIFMTIFLISLSANVYAETVREIKLQRTTEGWSIRGGSRVWVKGDILFFKFQRPANHKADKCKVSHLVVYLGSPHGNLKETKVICDDGYGYGLVKFLDLSNELVSPYDIEVSSVVTITNQYTPNYDPSETRRKKTCRELGYRYGNYPPNCKNVNEPDQHTR